MSGGEFLICQEAIGYVLHASLSGTSETKGKIDFALYLPKRDRMNCVAQITNISPTEPPAFCPICRKDKSLRCVNNPGRKFAPLLAIPFRGNQRGFKFINPSFTRVLVDFRKCFGSSLTLSARRSVMRQSLLDLSPGFSMKLERPQTLLGRARPLIPLGRDTLYFLVLTALPSYTTTPDVLEHDGLVVEGGGLLL